MPSFYPLLLAGGFLLGIALSTPAAELARSDLPPWMKHFEPGKLDLTYSGRDRSDEAKFNAFFWTPVFKGGGGVLDPGVVDPVTYGGGYVRPLAAYPNLGDLILGALSVQSDQRDDYEIQGEYWFPSGFGFGGGMVDTVNPATDVRFAKLNYRKTIKSWSFILEVQIQEVGETTSPGGYAAIYSDQFMLVAGNDGEQWRVTGGYIAPENSGRFRPAAEVIYVDQSIGHVDGPRTLLANATLGYKGGFLSNPSRLGRAMGPQGIEFSNPLGFLMPTWNRRMDVWELGGFAAARAERIEFPDGTISQRYEGLVFPFQFEEGPKLLDGIFVGGAYVENGQRATGSWLAGYLGATDFARGFVTVEHEVSPAETTLALGLIFPF